MARDTTIDARIRLVEVRFCNFDARSFQFDSEHRRLQTSTWLQLMSFYTYAASTAWCTYAAWSCLTYSESADLVPLLNVYEMLILFAPVGVLAWIDMSGVVYSLLTHLSFRHRRAYSLAIFWTIATALGIVVFLASAVFLGAFGLGIVALERIKRNIYSLRSFYRAHLVGGELVMDAEQTVELSRLYVELLEATAVCFRNKLQLTLFIIAASCTLLGLCVCPVLSRLTWLTFSEGSGPPSLSTSSGGCVRLLQLCSHPINNGIGLRVYQAATERYQGCDGRPSRSSKS